MKRMPSLILLVIMSCFFGTIHAEATTYTVKAGGGGDFTSISACASSAVAGDTCTVFAGSYSGWTQSNSGTPGNPITFQANGTTLTTCALTSCSGPNGDAVTITSGIDVSGRQYIQIIGFSIQGTISFNTSSNHNTVTHNHDTITLAYQVDAVGNTDSDNVFSYNVVDLTGIVTNATGFYFYGDRNRFEHNEIKNGEGDCHDLGGTNVIVRNEYCHDINGASGEHIDFVQEMGAGDTPVLTYSLIEGNVEQHCYNDGGNCHAVIIRTGGAPAADTIIYRHNYMQNLDGSGGNFGGVGDNVPNAWFYNNTIATESTVSENGSCAVWQNASTGVSFNNICYNVTAGNSNYSPFYSTTSDLAENGNISYTTGYSSSWGSPYSGETTYSALHNKNTVFANYPTDGTLQPTSPAIGAGVALTTVAAGDAGSGTSLIVHNAHGLQPGWAGTQGDWIRVGSTNTVQITAINYTTNTLTLASSISRSSGDPVYLYKNSNGQIVLFGSAPDIGAYQYFAPATNLGAAAH